MFALTRTTPAGVTKTHSPVAKLRDASVAASRVLADNAGTSKADAQQFAARLSKEPLGTELTHEPTGYRFRIDRTEL
jgi:hypothetical protein